MQDVRLKFKDGEFTPIDGVTTLGRTTDNLVSFPDDSNVSPTTPRSNRGQ